MTKKTRPPVRRETGDEINKTQLDIDKSLTRGIHHRDYLAHLFRWSHVLKWLRQTSRYKSATILDVGCGDMPLLRHLYVNRMSPLEYLGIDVRSGMADKLLKIMDPSCDWRFEQRDVIKEGLPPKNGYDEPWSCVVCFEMLEHVTREAGKALLDHLRSVVEYGGTTRPETTLFLSTPCYDGKTMAANHVCEWTHDELRSELEDRFTVEKVYGTFASKRDVESAIWKNRHRVHVDRRSVKWIWERLSEYYDTNALSIMLAPLFPEAARNCLWVCYVK